MKVFNIGPAELLFILVIALIIFGPGKLPEVARGLGKAVGDFRRASQGLTDDLTRELDASAAAARGQSEPATAPTAGAAQAMPSQTGSPHSGEVEPRSADGATTPPTAA